MATKAGRIKLEDLRQGKTIWKPAIGQHGWVPKAFRVEVGVKMRAIGLREDEQGVLRSYARAMYSLCHYGERRVFSTFHPSFNAAIHAVSDGSFAQWDAFITRKACERQCAAMNRGSYRVLNDLNLSIHDTYQNPYHVSRAQLGIPEAY